MIPAELQLRDEALTAAGHDPECAAFDDRDCSCGIAGAGPIRKLPSQRNGEPWVRPLDPEDITLSGDHARAYRRWTAAMRRLSEAKQAFAAAGVEAQAAHEALATLSCGAPP